MASKPLVSIVIECGTITISDRISFPQMAQSYLKEARKTLPDSKFEIFFIGKGLPRLQLAKNVRFVEMGQTGYYGWKNAGANMARGKIVVYWDSDCRIGEGYLRRVLEVLEKDPQTAGVAGRTRYDGRSFLTRVNTTLSFGYFGKVQGHITPPLTAVANNVSIRKSMFKKNPFGPFDGRVGGDVHLTRAAAQSGHPLRFDPLLQVFHEDPGSSPEAFEERHLRDLFNPFLVSPHRSKTGAFLSCMKSILTLPLWRLKVLFKYGPLSDLNFPERLLGVPVVILYGIADAFFALRVLLVPGLLGKRLRFQFGDQWVKDQGIRC